MTTRRSKQPALQPGRVYRTRELAKWGNSFAKRLAQEGHLVALARGLYSCPRRGRFGAVPPTDEELVRAFLDGGPFVFTGPDRWNALGLGTTAAFAMPLVYNTKRSGVFEFGERKMLLRRVAFPDRPVAEWFVVDLFEHADQAGTSAGPLTAALARAVRSGIFSADKLRAMAERYGTRTTRTAIEAALAEAAA